MQTRYTYLNGFQASTSLKNCPELKIHNMTFREF
jgi:hypothetical protein